MSNIPKETQPCRERAGPSRLSILYLVLIFTLALLSFRKGHWVLGLIGFVFPVLWLFGAILPARRHR